ncbi:hypothetical protein PS623_04365 [Pseudomonas fluorescens]|nr:hypothetical protein PS623_04365 [Pseudomonas fluorescens]
MVEHDLEQALLTRLRQCFKQLLERQVLMRLRLDRGLTHLGQQLAERLAAIELRTQHLGIDEEANHALSFQAWAVGIGHANADVVLPAVAVQQALPGSQQDHEQAGLLLLGKLLERGGELGRDFYAEALGAQCALARTRLIGGQIEHRQIITQLRLPVFKLCCSRALGQPLALPDAVIGVAQRQRWQADVLALAAGRVQASELIQQNVQRPAVSDDVVQRQPQLVLLIIQPRQSSAQQRPIAQIERLLRLGFAAGRNLRGVQPMQVKLSELQLQLRQHPLQGLAGDFAEHRTQRFMPADQRLQAVLQRGNVEFSAQVQAGRDVVGCRLRLQLPQQPQAVLRQRLRQWLSAAAHVDMSALLAAVSQQCSYRCAVVSQHRGVEQGAQAQLDAKLVCQLRGRLRGGNRVATQQQEVVIGRHRFDLEQVTPDGSDARLQGLCHRSRRRHAADRREARVAIKAAVIHALATGRALQLAAGSLR